MKKKTVKLMLLTGGLADVALLSVVYDWESALQSDWYKIYQNEVIIDMETNVYAHRVVNEEWEFMDKARENPDIINAVMKMTVMADMVVKKNQDTRFWRWARRTWLLRHWDTKAEREKRRGGISLIHDFRISGYK